MHNNIIIIMNKNNNKIERRGPYFIGIFSMDRREN